MDNGIDKLEGRLIAVEKGLIKMLDYFEYTVIAIITLTLSLILLTVCWFLGITSDSVLSYYKVLSNTPAWLMLLALIGFFGISYWSILKLLHTRIRLLVYDKISKSFLDSLD